MIYFKHLCINILFICACDLFLIAMTMLNGRVKGVDHLFAQANLWCVGSGLINAEFEFKKKTMKKRESVFSDAAVFSYNSSSEY